MLIRRHIVFTVTNDLVYDRRMQRICKTLAEKGFEVTLVGRKLKQSLSFNPNLYHWKRLTCLFNKGFLFYAEFNVRLLFWLLGKKFDVACACDLDTALPVSIYARLRKIKSVFDAHEFFTEVPEIAHRPGIKAVWEWIGRRTMTHFDLRYTVGEELAKLMGEKYKVHFSVIRNIAPAPPKSNHSADINSRKNILLYQGALNVGRGLDSLIEAMKFLPGWELWLAGEGDITDLLKKKVAVLHLSDQIEFKGWVKPDDLAPLMAQAKIGINLREAGSLNDYYSLPNKFFDFIHAGLPSINMAYPEYQKVFSQYPCGILLDEVTVDNLVDAIEDFQNNPELLETMHVHCLAASREFTWDTEAKKLILCYENLFLNLS